MNNFSVTDYSESKAELSNPSQPIKKLKLTRDGMIKISPIGTTRLLKCLAAKSLQWQGSGFKSLAASSCSFQEHSALHCKGIPQTNIQNVLVRTRFRHLVTAKCWLAVRKAVPHYNFAFPLAY